MPGLIASLMLLEESHLDWKEFYHVAMFIYNIQSILTFSAFASYVWAREYEENMMENLLCYPYSKQHIFYAKLLILLPVILVTSVLFVFASHMAAPFLVSGALELENVKEFVSIVGVMVIMHFLLLPFVLFVTMLSRQAVTGIILGVLFMLVCTIFYSSSFIQYIPFIIPMVLADHLLGFDKLILSGYTVPVIILLLTFAFSLGGCLWLLRSNKIHIQN